jgi:hypothetical protein
MKPNTRLLIRFTLPDGAMKGWGYDYPHYKTTQELHDAIVKDFVDWPANTEINLFYFEDDVVISATNAEQLAEKSIAWLSDLESYNVK